MLLVKNKTLREFCGVLETFNLLSVRLALKRPAQLRSFPGKIYRDYMTLVRNDKWRCIDITDILGHVDTIKINIEYIYGNGIYSSVEELAYMALLTKHCRPRNIFE